MEQSSLMAQNPFGGTGTLQPSVTGKQMLLDKAQSLVTGRPQHGNGQY
jgi:hypothetical protein